MSARGHFEMNAWRMCNCEGGNVKCETFSDWINIWKTFELKYCVRRKRRNFNVWWSIDWGWVRLMDSYCDEIPGENWWKLFNFRSENYWLNPSIHLNRKINLELKFLSNNFFIISARWSIKLSSSLSITWGKPKCIISSKVIYDEQNDIPLLIQL
jgi:hypothetical protein